MIYAKNQDAKLYKGFSPLLDYVMDLISDPAYLAALPMGTTELNGDKLYVICKEYDTKPLDEAFFEYHRKYIDVQLLLDGEETMGIASPQELELVDQHDDFYGCRGTAEQEVVLFPGSFLILFPTDAHECGVQTHGKTHVKKIVFKVITE